MAKLKEQYSVFDIGGDNIQMLYSVHTRPTKDGYITDISKLIYQRVGYTAHMVSCFKPLDEKEAIERHNEICQNLEKYIEKHLEELKKRQSNEVIF